MCVSKKSECVVILTGRAWFKLIFRHDAGVQTRSASCQRNCWREINNIPFSLLVIVKTTYCIASVRQCLLTLNTTHVEPGDINADTLEERLLGLF